MLDKENRAAYYEEKQVDIAADDAPDLSIEEQTQLALAVTLYMEATSTDFPRSGEPLGRITYKCAKTAVTFRKTRTEAVDKLNSFVDNYISTHSCKRKYGIDSGCVWEDFLCVSVQQLECDCK